MKKCIIFGAGATGQKIIDNIENYNIIGIVDNDKNKWDKRIYNNMYIKNPNYLKEVDFDRVIVSSLVGYKDIISQLKTMGISNEKIDTSFIDSDIFIDARSAFLKQFSSLCESVEGAVAEAGVFQGEFAKEINKVFSDRILYLFDTFEGFDKRDIINEFNVENKEVKSIVVGHFSSTSEELVLSKLPFIDKCIIKKGFFPDTTVGLEDEKFCFVNLDMDLYRPTLEGLRFFYPRINEGGCILIHDYFSDIYPNVKKAVKDFEVEQNIKLKKLPIGDKLSIAIIV